MNSIGSIVTTTTLGLLIFGFFLDIGAQNLFESISSINNLTHRALINIDLPSRVESFYGVLFPILAYDYLPVDNWYETVPGALFDPFSPKFEALGYES